MEKTFTKMEIAILKRTAQNVAQFVTKKGKYQAQIEKVKASRADLIAEKMKSIEESVDKTIATKVEKLETEISILQPIIDSFQGPIKAMTGGYTTEDLIDRVTEGTGKIDENTGKETMVTRFVLKYPDTVVPPCENSCPAAEVPNQGDNQVNCPTNEGVGDAALEEADPFAGDPFAGAQGNEDGSDDVALEAAKEAAETAFSDDENNW